MKLIIYGVLRTRALVAKGSGEDFRKTVAGMTKNKTIQPDPMTPLEKRAAMSLASIYAMRMLGLFMILPVFVLYADELTGSTPVLTGLAIGIYGLTQAVLQIPFGMLSDRYGRKLIIYLGLVIFAAGSVVAATSDSIYGVILGRALQGSGAIAAALMALTADLTREEHRLKAMAIIGMTIGFSFAVSMIVGPLLNKWIGVPGIFWLTAFLAIFGIALVKLWVPDPVESKFHRDTEPVPSQFTSVLSDKQLLRLDFGVMVLHMILTATFVVLPLALRDFAQLPSEDHWYVYMPVLLLSMFAMIPFVIIAESKRRMKQVFVSSILVISIAQTALVWFFDSAFYIGFILFVFFTAFNVLEASLPSLVAKVSPPDRKGTSMGVYSSSQFFGAFLGGMIGGWLFEQYSFTGVFSFCAFMAACWFLLAVTMQSPRYLSSHMIKLGEVNEADVPNLVVRLTKITGVAEAVVIPEDGIAYLKVDLHAMDREALQAFSVKSS